MTRRFVCVWIPVETVMTLLGQWKHQQFVALPWLERAADERGNAVDLPVGYEVVDATYAWDRKAIGIRLSHASFAEVPDGEYAPSLWFREVTIQVLPVKNNLTQMNYRLCKNTVLLHLQNLR